MQLRLFLEFLKLKLYKKALLLQGIELKEYS